MQLSTRHRVAVAPRPAAAEVAPASVHLVVTSPPYPMVEMWDACFAAQAPTIAEALSRTDGPTAFEAMHAVLDPIWADCHAALVPGGLMCVNVGDATRKLGDDFQLFSNHARTITGLLRAGFQLLPDILWRKPTNAPNKFMGSGMLPGGAYVTYEHEYVIIARKGGRRLFRTTADRQRRRRSAFFWEERNVWFSDVWQGLTGTRQAMKGASRSRSGAFPTELPARLIDMYSLQDDLVMDPFAGTGTTALAAAAAGRHSISVERDPSLAAHAVARLDQAPSTSAIRAGARLTAHHQFVRTRTATGKPPKHRNVPYDVPVVTKQEGDLSLPIARTVQATGPMTRDVATELGVAPPGWQLPLL